ncbi:thymidine kinase [Spiroplasma clarkii]|uniref:Thymidine kinase n=1 Tax=Spiroplasma clarkii TaxID=2139 RepID=A0A1Y0KYM9_9MOLU|nr:thymidine kinase [Spiroplasma clarkii]ARU90854.1 thymidine kinase [Spiroplasma clarkii]ATX71641.1 thymidine kinase [Spiroplasma clarkii]
MSYRINPSTKPGWIELITGCMFSGKTEEFIRRIRRYRYAKQKVIVFKPIIDQRYYEDKVASHSGMIVDSIPVASTKEMLDIINKETEKIDVIGIDEIQFFDEAVVDAVSELADQGILVIVNGLDKDYRNDAFKNVDRLLFMAEYVDKLAAICYVCGGNANRTQRIVDGVPAKKDEPLVVISANEKYEARCRHCYIKPS